MRGMAFAGVLLASAAGVSAQRPATTVQQDFERATALSNGQDKAAALAAWEALEKRTAGNKRNRGIVLVRKSEILFQLGHKDDAIAAAKEGLADLPASDPSLAADRMDAYRNLGGVAEAALDYASAAEAYRAALPLASTPTERLGVLRGLAQTETFTDPDRAGADLDRAEALLQTTKVDNGVRALFERLRGQWLLARGRFAEAAEIDKRAVRDLGGLTMYADLNDADARADTAIALLLAGKPEDAREYMAYTGAGRLPTGSFDPGVQMKVPDCGGDAGLKPADAAVIEFRVGDDGSVIDSVPVYAAGGGQAALAFARAARDWSWTPEEAKGLPPFFRYSARVELRCSTAFERPSLGSYLDQELGGWLAAKGVTLPPPMIGADATVLPRERQRLDEQQTALGRDALALVPTLIAIAENALSSREETQIDAGRAVAILAANGASPIARLAAERFVWESAEAESWLPASYARLVQPHLADPVYANDPKARSAIRLQLADVLRAHDSDRTRVLLQQVADDGGLAANDPLKVGALVRLASLEAGSGNLDQARAAFERTGLSADQCALLDTRPRMIASNATSGDFPREAMRWGFEGWTQVQFDVTADGKSKNVRAIVSYPPFVFTDAGTGVLTGARFAKSYRPDGGLGCGGDTTRVRFRMPS